MNCGATTSFTTNVAIQRTGLRIPWTGRDEVFVVESEAPVWVRWTDATHVVIAYRTAPAGPKKKASGVIQVAYARSAWGRHTPPCGGTRGITTPLKRATCAVRVPMIQQLQVLGPGSGSPSRAAAVPGRPRSSACGVALGAFGLRPATREIRS